MPLLYRKLLIQFFTFIGGLYFFLEFVLPVDSIPPEYLGGYAFQDIHRVVSTGVQIIGTMAIGLGIINIFMVHGGNIIQQRKKWANSLVLLLAFCLTMYLELHTIFQNEANARDRLNLETLGSLLASPEKETEKKIPVEKTLLFLKQEIARLEAEPPKGFTEAELLPAEQSVLSARTRLLAEVRNELDAVASAAPGPDQESRLQTLGGKTSELARAVYDVNEFAGRFTFLENAQKLVKESFFVALGSAMFALLAFYIANAAYRSFRIRSAEALIMMIAAVIVVLGQIPHGPLYISEDLPAARLWLLNQLNTPAFRAIFFGASVAVLGMALRVWLSLDRSPFGDVPDGRKGESNG